MLFGKPLNLIAIAADDDRIDLQPVAVRQDDAALLADGENGPHQMLVVPHPAGHAMHDQPQPALGHTPLPRSRSL